MRVNTAIDDWPGIQQLAICYQWLMQRLILSVSKPSISQQSQIKEDTVEPSVPAREFYLAVRVNRAIDDGPGIQQEAICYQWFKYSD